MPAEGMSCCKNTICLTFWFTVSHGLTRSYTVLHGLTRSYTILHGLKRPYTVLHGPTRSYTVLHGLAQAAPCSKSTLPYLQKAAPCCKNFPPYCRRYVPCCESTPFYCSSMRFIAKAPHTNAEDKCLVAKARHFIRRRHAPCSKSTSPYLHKACALLQKHSTLLAKGCAM